MSSVVISGDTSGTVSLTVPAVAGTNTATLPAATGTVMVSGNMPAFSATLTASNQNVTSGAATKCQFSVEEFDTNNCYDPTTNYRFTPNVAGYYQVNLAIYQTAALTTQLNIYVYKNGSQSKATAYVGATSQYCTMSTIIYCNGTTDYLEAYAIVSGANGVIQTGTLTYFQAFLARTA